MTLTSTGLVIGLLLGGIVTHLYDCKGFHRIPGAVELAIGATAAAEHRAHQQARQSNAEPQPSKRNSSAAQRHQLVTKVDSGFARATWISVKKILTRRLVNELNHLRGGILICAHRGSFACRFDRGDRVVAQEGT